MTPEELRIARMRLQLTQAEFGDLLGLTGQFIGMMERGQKPIEVRTALSARYLVENSTPNARITAFSFRDRFLALAAEVYSVVEIRELIKATQVQNSEGETFTFHLTPALFEPIDDCIENDRIMEQTRTALC